MFCCISLASVIQMSFVAYFISIVLAIVGALCGVEVRFQCIERLPHSMKKMFKTGFETGSKDRVKIYTFTYQETRLWHAITNQICQFLA